MNKGVCVVVGVGHFCWADHQLS